MNNKIIFITARFRAGSTLLWNIFRHLPQVVAYYEPLHEQLIEYMRDNIPVQEKHFYVDEYFKEYRQVRDLAKLHRSTFGVSNLYMEATDDDEALSDYIQCLIDAVPSGKIPVLQFNRIDFRLGWIKRHFPDAKIVHLFRSPRAEWMSMIGDNKGCNGEKLEEDPYRLTTWARDLCESFPFLATPHISHLYQRHYHIWKLSFLMGQRMADVTINYEDVLEDVTGEIGMLLSELDIEIPDMERLARLVKARTIGLWKAYREENWFHGLEKSCEDVLEQAGLNQNFGHMNLKDIISKNKTYSEMLMSEHHLRWRHQSAQMALVDFLNKMNEKEEEIRIYSLLSKTRKKIVSCLSQTVEKLDKQDFGQLEDEVEVLDHLQREISHNEEYNPDAVMVLTGELKGVSALLLQLIKSEKGILAEYQKYKLWSEERKGAMLLNESIANERYQLINELNAKIERLERKSIGVRLNKAHQRLRHRFAPRIGTLQQYPPRRLEIPENYHAVRSLTKVPKISIVTPSYNQGEFIERTICSVVDQRYPNLEYIVKDAGSDDETIGILSKYEDRIASWESKPDKGQAGAINQGLQACSGELMAYLNSDDLLLPGALNYVAHYFNRHPEVDVVYGHRVLIDDNDKEIGRWVMPPHVDDVLKWIDFIPQETMFWRRRIWEKAGAKIDDRFQFAMDWDLILRFIGAGAAIRRLPRFIGAFRVHAQQKTIAQISNTGSAEMAQLRQRIHQRTVSDDEAMRSVRGYLRRQVIYNKLFRLGLLRH